MITKEQIIQKLDKREYQESVVDALVEVSKEYNEVVEQLIDCNGNNIDLVRRERKLHRQEIVLRRKLGIYVEDKCGNKTCSSCEHINTEKNWCKKYNIPA